jgi:hypothetical protein
MTLMQKNVVIHRSFEESDQADREYYRSLTPQQRLAILLELNRQWAGKTDGTPDRLERVYRIIKFP